jgi:hypothetical protein
MSRNLQELESPWPVWSRVEGREVYERAFVRTVLHLRGAEGEETPLQSALGSKILKLHRLKVAIENCRLEVSHAAD